jgi:endonuclease/exonuclease/phosphatase (EEP) superfamily protein YafD
VTCDEPAPASPPASPGLATRAAAVAALAVVAAVAVSLTLRATARDALPVLSLLFLATPLVLDCAAAACAAVALWRLGAQRAAVLSAALAALSGALYASGSFVTNDAQPRGAIRGVLWNVARGRAGWTRIAGTLRALDPDVAWLAEATPSADADDALRSALPEHTLLRTDGGLAVLVRGEAELVSWTSLGRSSRLGRFRLQAGGREFESVQADIAAAPLARREPVLRRVLRHAAPLLDTPLLVLGDFNTPRDSCAFDAWRPRLSHAFETAGRGLDATWPQPLPVLSIDHVWASARIGVRSCELVATDASDHRAVLFTFDVR